MITFLPHTSFKKSAQCLDNKRLNKQIVEGVQIYQALSLIDEKGRLIKKMDKTTGWIHHPAILMWIGYESCLVLYIKACVDNWNQRFFADREIPINFADFDHVRFLDVKPPWLLKTFTDSHRSMLIQKSDYYLQFEWDVPVKPYYWPYVWSPVQNRRIQISPKVYSRISQKGDVHYKKELEKLKREIK